MKNHSSKNTKAMLAEVLSEYIFIALPFVFLIAIKLYAYSWEEIFLSPDWSLVSCIIFGQISIKMARSAIKYRHAEDRAFGYYSAKRFFLVSLSLLFYFGMVAKPTILLGIGQIALFILASFFHIKDGIAARILEEKINRN